MADQLAQDSNMVPEALRLSDNLDLVAAWHTPGGPTPCQPIPARHIVCARSAAELRRLQAVTQRQQERIAYVEKIADDAIELGNQQAIRIAALEAQVQALSLDAGRWQAMRQCLVGADFAPEMGGGPVVMFELYAKSVNAGSKGADEIADAAIAAGKGEG